MKRIRTLDQLYAAANARQSVVMPHSRVMARRPHPAAWILNMQGIRLVWLFAEGMFIYKKTATKLEQKEKK